MNKNTFIKLLTVISVVAMVAINALANILPINGITTGQVSDSYPNLFAPAGITFSIWGLIYLLLIGYVSYQFSPKSEEREKLFSRINILFIVSSIINSVWIFFWHYKMIALSAFLIIMLLYSLIKISSIANEKGFMIKDKLFVKIPFGIYFGWITIATIANITALLVSLGWRNVIISDQMWTIIILFIGLIITSLTAIRERNLAYGLVPVWAYLGIYLKHTSALSFNNMYPNIVIATIICIVVFIGVNGYLFVKKKII